MTEKNKKRVSLILSGGTIDSVRDGNFYRADSEVSQAFKDYGFKRITRALNMLSENAGFKEIETLYKYISAEVKKDDVDACVLTHGTDSLVYSAAALSLLLYRIEKPVVIVSANYPLKDERTNGFDNMEAAVRFINSQNQSGVFAAYKNTGERAKIHFGARLNFTRDFDGYVSSALDKICGYIDESGNFILKELPFKKQKENFRPQIKEEYQNKTILLVSYTGLDFNTLSHLQKERGFEIVLDAYHSGTVKTSGENNINLLKGIVFIAGGLKSEKYESVEMLFSPSVRFIDNITPAALYFKRVLSTGMDDITKENYLCANTCGEYF